MAVEKVKRKSGLRYRAVWRNPVTGAVEKGQWLDDKKEAARQDDQIKFRIKHDPESFRAVEKRGGDLRIAEICFLYETRAPMAESTRRNLRYHLKPLVARIGHIPAPDITHADLDALERSFAAAGTKQNTIQRKISILRSAYAWAKSEQMLSANPCLGHTTSRGDDAINHPPTVQETEKILRHAPEHVMRAVLIAYGSGARVGPSELLRVRWDDYEPETGRLRIWSAQKNPKIPYRWVFIKEEYQPLFGIWQAKDMAAGMLWIIHYRGLPITTFKSAWKSTLRRAGITRRIRPYDLRHAFVTELLRAGVDMKTTSALAGHADPTMILKRYQHVTSEDQERAAAKMPTLTLPNCGEQERVTNGTITPHFSLPADKFTQ